MENITYKNRIKHERVTAEKYLFRKQRKHQQEMLLVEKALSRISEECETFLDAPCGAGRMSFLAEEMGFTTTGIDLGQGILDCAKQEKAKMLSGVDFLKKDLENTGFENEQFDVSLCFRFFHHLPSVEAKINVITELTRISSKYVVISYFNTFSVTSFKRKIQGIINTPSVQHATSFKELNQYFTNCGFSLHYHKYVCPFIHTLCIAVFKRE